MKTLRYYQVNAFTGRNFSGNPAGVCLLEAWLEPGLMQSIAAENRLSDTAFLVPGNKGWNIRWFTPACEVSLCGHATLAAAHVLFRQGRAMDARILFQSAGGELQASLEGGLIHLDLPALPPETCPPPKALLEAFSFRPREVLRAEDYVLVFDSWSQVVKQQPKLDLLLGLDGRGVCITAPGRECDFVSRFFAPKLGIDEDPVTGSAHCELVPYWSRRLSKEHLHALQVSPRGGELFGLHSGSRVILSGQAVQYLEGRIFL